MINWYSIVEHIVNIWGFLAVVVISITLIACKALDMKREKQFFNFVSQEAPTEIHMSVTDDSAHYELDLK